MKDALSPRTYRALGQLTQIFNCAERALQRDITHPPRPGLQVTSIPPELSITQQGVQLNSDLLPHSPRESLLL